MKQYSQAQYKFYKDLDAQKVRKAADLLRNAFSWDVSPQGFDYWQTINNVLLQMSNDATLIRTPPIKLDRIADAKIALEQGFQWSNTTQGFSFWQTVYDALTSIECDELTRKLAPTEDTEWQ